ncbi:MAG: amidase [Paracoccaceae bacterium]|nr:amidase [Paracoccaceae bacterium]
MKQIMALTATEIGHKISIGKICPVELTEAYISEIKTCPNSKSIFTTIMKNNALKQAHDAKIRARNNSRRSLLDGVPISWKDVCDTEGIPTEAGSALLKNRVPKLNATIIENATNAGIISLGKTHMTELAFSGLGVNPITETPGNSLNPKLAPGGSSSGAAVSVALNLVSGSIGSDTGGSVRVPAAWNDLVGLKTTHGLVSLKGVIPLCPKFDTIGPIVKSVEDAANFLSAILSGENIKIQKDDLKTKRFAIIETLLLDKLDDKIAISFDKCLNSLANSGIQITRIKSSIISDAMALSSLVFSPEAYGTWKNVIEKDPTKMHPPVLERFRSGQNISGPDYVSAWQNLENLREKYIKLISNFDGILAPTTAILPPRINSLLSDNTYFSERNLLTLRNTRVANLMGIPAITIPTNDNFCGFMIMGNPFQEKSLLNIGNNMEKILKN